MVTQEFFPQILPPWVRSLAAGVPEAPEKEKPLPPAPPGTLFALAASCGWAVPPRPYELTFGRDEENVNIPIGVGDRHISRTHGRIICHGREWTMRNEGQLPMLLPGDDMLLSGQERLIAAPYTPVFIGDLGRRVHALEIRMVAGGIDKQAVGPGDSTVPPEAHPLSENERLVLTALARRYLDGEPHPQPRSWSQVAESMNLLPGERKWSEKAVARIVATVRERLSRPDYPRPVPGLLRDEVLGEPLGNALNDNLIRALVQSATLKPEDLDRLVDE